MTVRFDTWIEADSIQEAWGNLVYLMSQIADWGKLKAQKEFSATILEDGAEDKANIKGELTVRELFEWCLSHRNCEQCKPYETNYECPMQPGMDIEVITQIVRGYKPEGEKR